MREDQVIEERVQEQTSIPKLISTVQDKTAAIKEVKSLIRDIENDLPMELEDLMLQFKDLQKQVKERKAEHIKQIIEKNADYNSFRKQLQSEKEELADAKLKLLTAVSAESEDGNVSWILQVAGTPVSVQSEREVAVYINGKILK